MRHTRMLHPNVGNRERHNYKCIRNMAHQTEDRLIPFVFRAIHLSLPANPCMKTNGQTQVRFLFLQKLTPHVDTWTSVKTREREKRERLKAEPRKLDSALM
jgi:hypothetical protein